MKEFKIILSDNPEVGEVTDTIADLFQIGLTVENALEDGFQLTDFLAALQLEPVAREVINDFPVFIAQFKTLNGLTALKAVRDARDRTVEQFGDLGRVGTLIYDFLFQTADTFGFIQTTAQNAIAQLNAWQGLFKGVEKPAS